MNNYHTRLEIYKKALSDYRWARVKRFFRIPEKVHTFIREDGINTKGKLYAAGLCWYFTATYEVCELIYNLPELMEQRPLAENCWWFPVGQLTPRIKVLKAAIKLTKQRMNRA